MKAINLTDKVSELGVSIPNFESFWKIGDLTALRLDKEGSFYRSNYERGMLLYNLVAACRPKNILEFGTGRGYGAICMARALVDNAINGHIYTIDTRRYNEKQPWPIDYGDGPLVKELSLADVWPPSFPKEWLDRIRLLTGTSVEIVKNWSFMSRPQIDFAFIDGGHDYLTVKHDFYGLLTMVSDTFQVLFDDYADKPGFGICKFIDEEISPAFDIDLILADEGRIEEHGNETTDEKYFMALIDSKRKSEHWMTFFPRKQVSSYLSGYRRRLWVQKQIDTAKSILRPLVKMLRHKTKG